MKVTLLAYTQLALLPGHPIENGAGTPQENLIEYAGRVCYRSDDKMGHSPEFIGLRVREGHEDIIEHVRFVYEIDYLFTLPLDTFAALVSLPSVQSTISDYLDMGATIVVSMNARNVRDFWRNTGSDIAREMVTLAKPILPAVFGDIEL